MTARVASMARLLAHYGRERELLDLLVARVAVADEEPGTELFVVHADPTDPRVVWVYEVYTDAAAERAHQRGRGYAEALAALLELLDGEPQVFPLAPAAGKGLQESHGGAQA